MSAFVECRNIFKSFGGVRALDDVSLSVDRGEVRGLLGENGAGKSTLMKILYGLYSPDTGSIVVDGTSVAIRAPVDSIRLGIGMVHQVSTLVPEFTAIENIVMGTDGDPFRLPLTKTKKRIAQLTDEFGLSFPPDTRVKTLSAGVKQKVEIARALFRGAELLILDEPTTSLVESEFRQLLASLNALVARGVTVIFITHKMREVMEACHSVTVLRKGRVQSSIGREEMTTERLVKLMFTEQDIAVTESALPQIEVGSTERTRDPVLRLTSVHTGSDRDGADVTGNLTDVTLDVHGGEIVGVAAVSGNGERQLAEIVVHPRMISHGRIEINGESLAGRSTLDVFSRGVAFTPEDRAREGILTEGTITENVLLGHHGEARFTRKGIVDWRSVHVAAKETIRRFRVDTPDENLPIRRLSGGNIQKVIMGRALLSEPRLLVTHNPTSGLDFSTVEFIFRQLVALRAAGGAVLWINEDLDELMMLSDRIAVLHRGTIAGVFNRDEFDKYQIGLRMIGGEA